MVEVMWTGEDKKVKNENETDKKKSLLLLVPLSPYLSIMRVYKGTRVHEGFWCHDQTAYSPLIVSEIQVITVPPS